jgi:predicted phage terminase large subunit-like protein
VSGRRSKPASLVNAIPRMNPKLRAPRHLAPICDLFDRAFNGEDLLACYSAPPRHWKTFTEIYAAARELRANPELRIAYLMYASKPAQKRSREIKEAYLRLGGKIAADSRSKADWRTGVGEGGLWASAPDGPITGEGFNRIFISDIHKDRARAESSGELEKVWAWYNDVCFTRREPGCSILVGGARWVPHDLIGRLVEGGYEYVNLPALNSQGRALLPESFNEAALFKIREQLGEYGWSSLYMGQPRPRGGALFCDVYFFDGLPTTRVRFAIGLDLAYSTRSKSDYSVAVVMAECDGVYYVVEVGRWQMQAPDVLNRVTALSAKYGNARITMYSAGAEKGVLDLFQKQMGLRIDARPAVQDKFTRAQPVAAAWNAKKILLPREAQWLDPFVNEIISFTGLNDFHDDQIDALAAAFDSLARASRHSTFSPAAHARSWRDAQAQAHRDNPAVDPGCSNPFAEYDPATGGQYYTQEHSHLAGAGLSGHLAHNVVGPMVGAH